ncbi:MAG: response regulator [Pseudomonadota bacterium]
MTRLDDLPALAGLVTWHARLPGPEFLHVSRSSKQVFGYPPGRWAEPDFWQNTIHPEDRNDVVQFCIDSSNVGSDHVFDYRMIDARGRVLMVRDLISVRRGPSGEPLLFGAFIDISGEAAINQGVQARRPDIHAELPTITDIEAKISDEPALGRLPQARLADIVSIATSARRAACRDSGVAEGQVPLSVHPSLGGTVNVDPDYLRGAVRLLIHTALLGPRPGCSVEIDSDQDGLRVSLAVSSDSNAGQLTATQIRERALLVARTAWLVGRLGGHTRLGTGAGRLWAEELSIPLPEPPSGAEARSGSSALLRVLYAEDNVTSAQVMSALLGLQGVHSEIAINGEDAVTLWSEGAFDMVLMDVQMPVLDGVAATRRIRSRERERPGPPTPIIGISAHLDDEVRARCLEAGMDDLLAKPVRLEQLRALVERFGPGRWPRF